MPFNCWSSAVRVDWFVDYRFDNESRTWLITFQHMHSHFKWMPSLECECICWIVINHVRDCRFIIKSNYINWCSWKTKMTLLKVCLVLFYRRNVCVVWVPMEHVYREKLSAQNKYTKWEYAMNCVYVNMIILALFSFISWQKHIGKI